MMTAIGDLVVKLSANSASFQTEIARAKSLGTDYYKAIEQGNRKAEAASRQSQKALAEINGQLTSVRAAAMSMASVFVGLFAVGNIIKAADQWGQYQSRIKMTTGSVDEFRMVQQRLLEISDRTYKNIDEQAELYIRTSSAMKELGYSTSRTVDFIDSISSSLTINAASAEKGQSAIDALSKAMVKGKLSGLEWNTVMAVMPTVIGDIARYLGTTEIAVKSMAAAGKLSMDTFAKATIAAKNRNAELAEKMPTTVGDAITKLNNHFKTYISDVNASSGATQALSGVIGYLADHIDGIVTGVGVLAGVGLARTIGEWANSTALAAQRIASQTQNQLALAAAQREGLSITLSQITAERATAVTAQQSLVAQLKLAQTEQARTVIRKQLAVNSAEITRLTRAETAATAELSAVQGRLSASAGVLKGAMGLLGGPAGIAMLAGAAVFYYYQKTQQAREESLAFADSLGAVVDKMNSLNQAQLRGALADTANSIIAQKDRIRELEKEQIAAQNELKKYSDLVVQFGVQQDQANGYVIKAAEAQRNLDKAARDLNNAKEKLTDTTNKQAQIQGELNSKAQASDAAFNVLKKGLEDTYHLSGAAAAGLATTLQVLRELNAEQGKSGESGKPLIDTSKYDLYIKSQQESLALLKAQGVERAKLKAVQGAISSGALLTDNSGNVIDDMKAHKAQIEANASAEYNLQQQQQKRTGATKTGASVTGDYQQKIANLNKEIQVEGVRLKEGEAAAALFSASLETGAKWTETQREELERLNKKLAEAKQRWEDHNAAIASDPYRAAADAQKKANEQLQRQIVAGEIKSAEELARRKQQIHIDYLQSKAEADQRYAITGVAELAGNVDPLQNIDNQLAKRQALIESYAAAGVLSEQRKNQLILASETETNKQRLEAALQLYAAQGDMQSMAVDLFQSTKERATNMLTGLLTGTQNWKEAMSNLFSSLTQSIIQNLVDMAAQAIVTSTIMKTITGVSSGLMGGFGGAASSVAGAASSADTGAMGMSTSYLAYDLGGFTGQGGKYEPAGVVHKGEFVFTKEATERIGVENLYGMMRGYAAGGVVSPTASPSSGVRAVTASQPGITASSSVPMVNITIYNDGQTSTATTPGMEQFGSEIGRFVDQRFKVLLQKETGQGRLLSTAIKGKR